jgi:hypothetical protein
MISSHSLSFRKLLLVVAISVSCASQSSKNSLAQQTTKSKQEIRNQIQAVCNNCKRPVRFMTYKDKHVGTIYISPISKIKIVAPTEAVILTKTGDVAVLYQLVELLDNRDRGWAAFTLLAQMTDNHNRVLWSNPEKWWKEQGINGREKRRWLGLLKAASKDLYWNPQKGYFMYRQPIDHFPPG